MLPYRRLRYDTGLDREFSGIYRYFILFRFRFSRSRHLPILPRRDWTARYGISVIVAIYYDSLELAQDGWIISI